MDLGPRGARLWASLLAQDATLEDEQNPAREVAVTACRTADRLDWLEQMTVDTEPVVEGRQGPMIHPLFAEVRQQSQLFARLVAALRLPDEATGRKPQRRPMRGAHAPPPVNMRDRMRSA
jgi:hypothetical protein